MGCGDCTVCCSLFIIDELDKPKFVLCKHCNGTGCSIHKTRPETCRNFKCAYLVASEKGFAWREELRPDKSGVMIWLSKKGYEAVKVAEHTSLEIRKHIKGIEKKNDIRMLYIDGTPK